MSNNPTMHTEIKTPSEKDIQLAERYLQLAREARALRLLAHRREKEFRKTALFLLEIPVVKLP